jgi:ABC-type amino acid transport substrate-binding protein
VPDTGKGEEMSTERTRLRWLPAMGVLVALALVVGACADNGESITIGVANEVPYGYIGDDGEPTGIGPDVARAVLEELGYTDIRAEVVEFGELIGGLQAGQFDIVTAGMYITPDRAEQVHFSDPDYCIQESLAVEAGNPHGMAVLEVVHEDVFRFLVQHKPFLGGHVACEGSVPVGVILRDVQQHRHPRPKAVDSGQVEARDLRRDDRAFGSADDRFR